MGKAFVICGAPASGKSTYGAALAQKHSAALLDIDTCTELLVKSALRITNRDPNDRDSLYFKETFREPIYSTLFNIARENLPWIDTVIVGPFTKELQSHDWLQRLKEDLCAEVEIHYLTADINEIKKRMEIRNNPRDIPKLNDWDSYIKYFEGMKRPVFDHIFINTSSCTKV